MSRRYQLITAAGCGLLGVAVAMGAYATAADMPTAAGTAWAALIGFTVVGGGSASLLLIVCGAEDTNRRVDQLTHGWQYRRVNDPYPTADLGTLLAMPRSRRGDEMAIAEAAGVTPDGER